MIHYWKKTKNNDKIEAKNRREKIKIKRYAIIWGFLTLNIIRLIFSFYIFNNKFEKKGYFKLIKKLILDIIYPKTI